MKHKITQETLIVQQKNFYMYVRARSLKNPKNYNTSLIEFLVWAENHDVSHVVDITQHHIQAYYHYISNRPNTRRGGTLSVSSINHHLGTLHMFFDFLLQAGEIQKSFCIPRCKSQNKESKYIITRNEIDELYAACINNLETSLLHICYGCGLRRSEAYALDVSDIQFHASKLIVCSGKFDKRREVPVSDVLLHGLKTYITHERHDYLQGKSYSNPAFFIDSKGCRISKAQLNNMLKQIVARTENQDLQEKKISLHSLRHAIATHLLENNAGFEKVQAFLGHNTLDTTQIYAVQRKKQTLLYI